MFTITLPKAPKIIKDEGNRGVFEIDGCWPGYGITLGNAMRRVMLSSLPGAAVTAIKIKGVSHEFSTLPNVLEDVVQIILTMKQLRFKMHGEEPQTLILKAKGEKEVTGKDIQCPSQVELLNKNLKIVTLTNKKAEFEAEIEVSYGMGYSTVESRKREKLEIGNMLVDAIFTPIRKVNFEVENMRVGDRTDFNKLIFDIETDGSISPREAMENSAKILVAQFDVLCNFDEDQEKSGNNEETDEDEMTNILKTKIEDLNLSGRAINALTAGGIKTIAGLIKKSEADLTEFKGMGDKAIEEIVKVLKKLGLSLKEEK